MQLICGVEKVNKKPLVPYSNYVCDFLDVLSSALRKDSEAKRYPDVQTFSFWIRKSNIQKKKEEYEERQKGRLTVGKGIVFHISPSNVPVNCFFTYVFGLLAGNSNIVRLPSKQLEQIDCVCRIINEIFSDKKFEIIKERTSFIRYERNKDITDDLSKECNVRVIWGGDTTIEEIRKSPLLPRSTEITFADRYSFGYIDVKKLMNSSEKEKNELAENFYNDTYLMDQNACSTPHLILWDTKCVSEKKIDLIKKDFWKRVADISRKYDLADIKISEKYSLLCEQVMCRSDISDISTYSNLLYVVTLNKVPHDVFESCRGKFGCFYEAATDSLEILDSFNNEKVQTMAYFGDDISEIKKYIAANGFLGIDRVVPFGKTLDIDIVWDGYELIPQMSRIIG